MDVGRGGDHLDTEGHALAHAPLFSPRPLLRHGVVQQVSEDAEQPSSSEVLHFADHAFDLVANLVLEPLGETRQLLHGL